MLDCPDKTDGCNVPTFRLCWVILGVAMITLGLGSCVKAEESNTELRKAPPLDSEVIPLDTIAKTSHNPPLVVDGFTGLAIYGFDPVHYFTDNKAEKGIGIFEYRWQGGYWWFMNIRNRDIFARDPEVYAPSYGGYDPVELSRGRLVAGDPYQFAVYGSKLYLFAKQANVKYLADDDGLLGKADEHWKDVNHLRN